MSEKNIVILGAGFAGLKVALELSKKFHTLGPRKIILVDKKLMHTYTPLLYEVATGYFNKEVKGCEGILAEGTCVALENLLHIAGHAGIDFYQGEVQDVNFEHKEVLLDKDKKINFEYLVVALGSETDFFGIPGLQERAFSLKTIDDALNIRRKILSLSEKKKDISIIIGGGGATGVELAAEMSCYGKKIKDINFDITLVEAADRILPFLEESHSNFAEKRLNKLGVKVKENTFIKEVYDSTIKTKKDGRQKEISADLVIWTGGIKANSVLRQLDLPLDKKGRLEVSSDFIIKGKERIFALGDNAFLANEKGRAVPALAQAAIKEGEIVAENIIRDIKGEEKVKYDFPGMNTIIPLGGKYALAIAFGVTVKGFLAWLLRQAADLRYFLSILPFREALRIWWKGALVYIQND